MLVFNPLRHFAANMYECIMVIGILWLNCIYVTF